MTLQKIECVQSRVELGGKKLTAQDTKHGHSKGLKLDSTKGLKWTKFEIFAEVGKLILSLKDTTNDVNLLGINSKMFTVISCRPKIKPCF